MIENLPFYISSTFILTTFLTLGFFFYAVKQTAFDTLPAKILFFLIPFWLFFTAILALGKFYEYTESFPPRIILFGVFPALLLIIVYFLFFRTNFVEKLPLKVLTLIHVIRIPVEVVLLMLFQNGLIPQTMTFEGANFDILSGISAPIIYWLAFRNKETNSKLLLVWNAAALTLVLTIVFIAIISLPTPLQQINFAQPNRAVLYFPYIWLPLIVVPVVLFSHLASIWKLYKFLQIKKT